MRTNLIMDENKRFNSINWEEVLNYESMSNLEYMGMCLNEALRIDPPASSSSTICLTESTTIGGKMIGSDLRISVNIWALQNNPQEWHTPDIFIPERFDPSSKYFSRPDGKKRHPMSFSPFLGGKRICLGKTFAENMSKCILSIIVSQLKFDFVDKTDYVKKPNNGLSVQEIVMMANISVDY